MIILNEDHLFFLQIYMILDVLFKGNRCQFDLDGRITYA